MAGFQTTQSKNLIPSGPEGALVGLVLFALGLGLVITARRTQKVQVRL
jgi:hypothetical protein